MAAKKSREESMDDKIVSAFMTYALEHEKTPVSVYKFCKEIAVSEDAFYKSYGSLDAVKKDIWNRFFQNTLSLLEKNKDYSGFSNKEKMLTFFFTMFELLTLNRSYVLFVLKEHDNLPKNMTQLKGLRKRVKEYAADLIDQGNATKAYKISKHNPTVFSEGAWLQFLFLLKFWADDDSAGFERTDMAIEKSVNTIFDIFDNTPLDSLFDFGKFLYKEHLT